MGIEVTIILTVICTLLVVAIVMIIFNYVQYTNAFAARYLPTTKNDVTAANSVSTMDKLKGLFRRNSSPTPKVVDFPKEAQEQEIKQIALPTAPTPIKGGKKNKMSRISRSKSKRKSQLSSPIEQDPIIPTASKRKSFMSKSLDRSKPTESMEEKKFKRRTVAMVIDSNIPKESQESQETQEPSPLLQTHHPRDSDAYNQILDAYQ